MNKKTIAVFVLVAVLLFYVKKSFFTKDVISSSEVTTTQTSTPTTNLPAEAAPTVDTGWKDLYSEIGYDWVAPIETDKATKELPIKGYNTTYRINTTCIQQFKLEDGTIVSFKADVDNQANYLETPTGSGNFSPEPWPKSEHTKVWKKTESVSFRPLYGQPLALRVGRTR